MRALRNELGFSQERLAEDAGLHWTYVSGVERGIRNPSLDAIEKLARGLKVGPGDLFQFGEAVKKHPQRTKR